MANGAFLRSRAVWTVAVLYISRNITFSRLPMTCQGVCEIPPPPSLSLFAVRIVGDLLSVERRRRRRRQRNRVFPIVDDRWTGVRRYPRRGWRRVIDRTNGEREGEWVTPRRKPTLVSGSSVEFWKTGEPWWLRGGFVSGAKPRIRMPRRKGEETK